MKHSKIRRDFVETDSDYLDASIVWNCLVEPGDRIAGELIQTFGPVEALRVFHQKKNLENEVSEAVARWSPRFNPNLLETRLQAAERNDMKLLLPTDSLWPARLNDLGLHAPLLLWYRGNVRHFEALSKSIGVVGSRNATAYGQRVTSELVNQIVQNDAAVVSGGALGIDSVAHRTTIRLDGLTIAFMAGSLDRLYPSANHELFDEIGHRGLLLSEMSPGSNPTRWRFLQRNRLIAAVSEATVVCEAGWRSGSINTVNHASTLGRPVFAIPGPITSPASAGSNRLIRDSVATLLLDVEDLASELGWREASTATLDGLGELELRALDVLNSNFQEITAILISSGLSLSELQIALGSLRLMGKVESDQNGKWKRSFIR